MFIRHGDHLESRRSRCTGDVQFDSSCYGLSTVDVSETREGSVLRAFQNISVQQMMPSAKGTRIVVFYEYFKSKSIYLEKNISSLTRTT